MTGQRYSIIISEVYGLFYRLRKLSEDFFYVYVKGMARKYMDITELNAEIIRSFVERNEVLQPEKVPGTRAKKQTIVIYWNLIEAVEIPNEKEKTA